MLPSLWCLDARILVLTLETLSRSSASVRCLDILKTPDMSYSIPSDRPNNVSYNIVPCVPYRAIPCRAVPCHAVPCRALP